MHSVDLSKYDLRTDLVIEKIDKNIIDNHYEENNIMVDDIILKENNLLNKRPGKYTTISFEDITDKNNYYNVLSILKKEIQKMLDFIKIKKDSTCLIIGLGNKDIIPSLFSKSLFSLTI